MNAIRSILVALTTLMPATGLGNDAAYHGEGATVFAYKEQRIRMVSEHIRIRRAPDPKYPHASWVADCRFEFENLNDTPTTIQMGFPDQGAFPPGAWTIRAFETTIKGRRVAVAHKTVDPNHGHVSQTMMMRLNGEKPKPLPFAADHDPDGWRAMARAAMKEMNLRFAAAYTWPVAFGPKERLVVENSYRFGGAGTNGPITVCMEGLPMPRTGGFWYDLGGRYDLGSSGCSEVKYVVTTGRTWHGPIGKALIEIELSDGRPPNHIIPLPPATEVTRNVVRWRFENFTPKQELRVIFAHSRYFEEERDHAYLDFSSPKQVKRWLEFAAVNGFTRGAIEYMRDLQAYSFGLRTPSAPVPSPFVGGASEPVAKRPRTRSQLTKVQRQILDTLDEAVRTATSAKGSIE